MSYHISTQVYLSCLLFWVRCFLGVGSCRFRFSVRYALFFQYCVVLVCMILIVLFSVFWVFWGCVQGVVNVTRDRCRTVAGFRFKATSGREPRINFPRTVVEDDYYPTKIHDFFYFEKSCVSWKLGLFHSPQVCQVCECAVGLVVGTADLQSFNIACPLRTVPGSNISSLQFHSFTAFYGTSRCTNTCI